MRRSMAVSMCLVVLGCATAKPKPVDALPPVLTEPDSAHALGLLNLQELVEGGCDTAEGLRTGEELNSRLFGLSLQVDVTISRIQAEQAVVEEISSELQARHDTRVDLLSIAGGVLGA